MSKENPNEFKIINKNERLKYRQIINQLKQQLAEKQNTIDEINKEFVQAVHDWKTLCAEKDKEIEHLKDGLNMCQSIKRYDVGEMLIENTKLKQLKHQLDQLKQQLVEKEKELTYMTKQAKKFNNEAQKYYEDAYCNSFQNQKAIAELEKFRAKLVNRFNPVELSYTEYVQKLFEIINQQIKELKGE